MVIAAFLGLSLPLRWGFASALFEMDDFCGWTDAFWASDSGRLILATSWQI